MPAVKGTAVTPTYGAQIVNWGSVPADEVGAAGAVLDRARHGSERLNGILIAMGAATRVEEAIGNAERVRFDLVPVVQAAADSYRIAFPERAFATETPV